MRALTKLKKLRNWLIAGALTYVLAVNMAVRHYGGDANPLSVLRLGEKSKALLRLGLHSVRHLWNNDCDETSGFVAEAARKVGIPVSFALAIAQTESRFRSHTISSTGAMGVMQLMPSTASRYGVLDPFDPESNALGGARFLSDLWKRYHGDRMRVAAAYNAGEGGVPLRGPLHVPGTTLSYAASVVKRDHRVAPIDCFSAPLVITAHERY